MQAVAEAVPRLSSPLTPHRQHRLRGNPGSTHIPATNMVVAANVAYHPLRKD
jgi:hypothetical protein